MNTDHLMWSTDYPHTGTDWPNNRVSIERNFRGVERDTVKKMLHDNCRSLYKLDHVPDTVGVSEDRVRPEGRAGHGRRPRPGRGRGTAPGGTRRARRSR